MSSLDCSSYRPIRVTCNLSKILEYILLPFINLNAYFRENQPGFQSRIGCQHTNRGLSCLFKDACAKGYGLHIYALVFLRLSIALYTVMLFILFVLIPLAFRWFSFLSSGIVNAIFELKLMVPFLFYCPCSSGFTAGWSLIYKYV